MLAVRQHAVADFKTDDPRADFDHRPDVAVTEFERLIELVEDRFQRGEEAVGLNLFENLADFFGLLPGFADPARFAEIGQHPLGAGGNQRSPRLNQEMTGPRAGARHIDDLRDTVAQRLQNLAHPGPPTQLPGARPPWPVHPASAAGW